MKGIDYHNRSAQHSQWALKWDRVFENFDGSLSYFEGIDPMPVLLPGNLSSTGAVVEVQAQRARVVGADFSMIGMQCVFPGPGDNLQSEAISTGGKCRPVTQLPSSYCDP